MSHSGNQWMKLCSLGQTVEQISRFLLQHSLCLKVVFSTGQTVFNCEFDAEILQI